MKYVNKNLKFRESLNFNYLFDFEEEEEDEEIFKFE